MRRTCDKIGSRWSKGDWLRKLWDSGFRDPVTANAEYGGSFLKIWDGFTFKLANDGGTITDGKSFRYWIKLK